VKPIPLQLAARGPPSPGIRRTRQLASTRLRTSRRPKKKVAEVVRRQTDAKRTRLLTADFARLLPGSAQSGYGATGKQFHPPTPRSRQTVSSSIGVTCSPQRLKRARQRKKSNRLREVDLAERVSFRPAKKFSDERFSRTWTAVGGRERGKQEAGASVPISIGRRLCLQELSPPAWRFPVGPNQVPISMIDGGHDHVSPVIGKRSPTPRSLTRQLGRPHLRRHTG